jgi:Flp pilus assembly protein TadD
MTLGTTYRFNQRAGADERARWFQAAIAAHPRDVAAHINLGQFLLDKGDVDGAVTCHREAIRLDPKFAPALYNLGIALQTKGDADGAAALYKEAVRLKTNDAPAHNNLGRRLDRHRTSRRGHLRRGWADRARTASGGVRS